jgi:hypothetical protein
MDLLHPTTPATIGAILHRLSAQSARPRYAFFVLNLISEAAEARGKAGPFISQPGGAITIRDWLTEQLMPVSARDGRRGLLRERLREEMAESDAETVEAAIQERALPVGKTNISRAVSDLVRAGLVERHYAGWVKDHANCGGGRHAVYTVACEAMSVLRGGAARTDQPQLL